jgi:hypothetical protein
MKLIQQFYTFVGNIGGAYFDSTPVTKKEQLTKLLQRTTFSGVARAKPNFRRASGHSRVSGSSLQRPHHSAPT